MVGGFGLLLCIFTCSFVLVRSHQEVYQSPAVTKPEAPSNFAPRNRAPVNCTNAYDAPEFRVAQVGAIELGTLQCGLEKRGFSQVRSFEPRI